MSAETTKKELSFWAKFRYSFPVQLVLINIQKNQVVLLVWVFLFGIVLNRVAEKYGVSYLFLAPEYQGEQSFVSYGIVGFSLGGFILAFNLYSYIMHGYRFPFLATLNRPLVKFSINNFIIPGVFLLVYIYESVVFQSEFELLSNGRIAIHILGLITGILLFQIFSSIYFITTNKSVVKIVAEGLPDPAKSVTTAIPRSTAEIHEKQNSRKVLTYMSSFFRFRLARDYSHYEKQLLDKVLAQNHINASIFEIVTVGSFIFIGSFGENPMFEIPAASSLVLMLTTGLMLFSAFYSWFKGWTISLIIVLFLIANYQLVKLDWLQAESRAFGLKYSGVQAHYDPQSHGLEVVSDSIWKSDFKHNISILENWRLKNSKASFRTGKKPKLVVICTSGGGTRSALWTMNCISILDSLSEGQLLKQTHMITGSSGGLIGAAYLREIYRQSLIYPDSISLNDPIYRENISKDILNPMIFKLATTDLFIKYQKFKLDNEIYTKDRGYAFEKQLNENTGGVLWKQLGDYTQAEYNSTIPLLVMSPTIVNDGRRMIISSQPMSFMSRSEYLPLSEDNDIYENIEFRRLFANQNPDEVLMTSALRMNATFPLIMPSVSLPSEPVIEVMDAGLRDNFGIKTSLDYMNTFQNWISTNTSGVVIVQIRDKQKDFKNSNKSVSMWSKFSAPLGSVYGNFTRMQDFTNDQLLKYFKESVDYPVDVLDFQLAQESDELISLSWHLTEIEKDKVQKALYLPENKEVAVELMKLLQIDKK